MCFLILIFNNYTKSIIEVDKDEEKININNLDYNGIFQNSAYYSKTGGIVVNYTQLVAPIIDQIIATKNGGKVYKGSLITE